MPSPNIQMLVQALLRQNTAGPQPAMQQPSLDYVRDPSLYQPTVFQSQQPPRQQQSSGGGLPSGLFDQLMPNGGGAAGANTAGTVATDSGSFGASPYAFADSSGAYGGLGGGAAPAAGEFGGSGGAAGGAGGAGGLAALAPFGYAAAIGVGANTQANHANTPLGDGLLAGMAPSLAQLIKDPKGMGIPTALGFPFLTPFTASKEAKAEKPEFSSIFSLGF